MPTKVAWIWVSLVVTNSLWACLREREFSMEQSTYMFAHVLKAAMILTVVIVINSWIMYSRPYKKKKICKCPQTELDFGRKSCDQ